MSSSGDHKDLFIFVKASMSVFEHRIMVFYSILELCNIAQLEPLCNRSRLEFLCNRSRILSFFYVSTISTKKYYSGRKEEVNRSNRDT